MLGRRIFLGKGIKMQMTGPQQDLSLFQAQNAREKGKKVGDEVREVARSRRDLGTRVGSSGFRPRAMGSPLSVGE